MKIPSELRLAIVSVCKSQSSLYSRQQVEQDAAVAKFLASPEAKIVNSALEKRPALVKALDDNTAIFVRYGLYPKTGDDSGPNVRMYDHEDFENVSGIKMKTSEGFEPHLVFAEIAKAKNLAEVQPLLKRMGIVYE